jgi:hypothetical protein
LAYQEGLGITDRALLKKNNVTLSGRQNTVIKQTFCNGGTTTHVSSFNSVMNLRHKILFLILFSIFRIERLRYHVPVSAQTH